MLSSTLLSAATLWLSCGAGAMFDSAPAADTLLEDRHVHHPVHVSPEMFANIQRYANFSSASTTNGNCPYPPYGTVLAHQVNVESTSTQASLFRDDSRKEFILAFPGTASRRDDKTDSEHSKATYRTKGVPREKCPGCKAHKGFLFAWNSAVPAVAEALDKNLKEYPDYHVTITGHSLGAALASLATSSLKGMKYPIHNTFTYGEPRVGNREFANHIDEISGAHKGRISPAGSYHRVTHANDGVPQVPRRASGYRHPRTEYWEYNTKETNAETGNRVVRCWGQEPENCNNAHKPPTTFVSAHMYYGGITIGDPASCGL